MISDRHYSHPPELLDRFDLVDARADFVLYKRTAVDAERVVHMREYMAQVATDSDC